SVTAMASTGQALAAWRDRGASLTRVQRQSLAMGSVVSFDVVAPSEEDGYAAVNEAMEIFRALDATLSMYRPDSEVAALEEAAGDTAVSISSDTATVLRRAQALARTTDGRFDVTIEPLMRRWGFRDSPESPVSPPTDTQLRRLQSLVDYRKLSVKDDRAFLERAGMALDLGGIAGGYALDRAIETMQSMNVAAALINFSGDLHCFGRPASGQPWTVHLVDPATLEPREDAIPLRDEALSTSGSYQNRRHTRSGDSWGHLLQPDLGSPVEPTGSVTAIHPSALEADAWSTALYLGAEARDPDLRSIRLSAD
ncbi:MAG: FAD:protein FMN transferase, partial [Salinibacter sp.]